MVPVTQPLVEAIRFCRWGAYYSLIASLAQINFRDVTGFYLPTCDFSESGMGAEEYDKIFRYFDSTSTDTGFLQTFMSLAIASGDQRIVDYLLSNPYYELIADDYKVCLLIGTAAMLRRLTWKNHYLLSINVSGVDSAAMVLAKSAHNTFVDNADQTRHVPEFREKVVHLIKMGISMFSVDVSGYTVYTLMIMNRVPVDIIALITPTLTKAQLNFVDRRYDTPLSIAVNTEQPGVIRHLIESGACPFANPLICEGDLRTRLSPMRLMVLTSWRKDCRRYLTLLELAHRNLSFDPEGIYIKYRMLNYHMMYLLGEMGLHFTFQKDYEKMLAKDPNVKRAHWLRKFYNYASKPRTLQSFARTAVLRPTPVGTHISSRVEQIVKEKRLPFHMLEYLLFKPEIMIIEAYRSSTVENPVPGWYDRNDPKCEFEDSVAKIDFSL